MDSNLDYFKQYSSLTQNYNDSYKTDLPQYDGKNIKTETSSNYGIPSPKYQDNFTQNWQKNT